MPITAPACWLNKEVRNKMRLAQRLRCPCQMQQVIQLRFLVLLIGEQVSVAEQPSPVKFGTEAPYSYQGATIYGVPISVKRRCERSDQAETEKPLSPDDTYNAWRARGSVHLSGFLVAFFSSLVFFC